MLGLISSKKTALFERRYIESREEACGCIILSLDCTKNASATVDGRFHPKTTT
jgi:hypothetical protein